MNKQSEIAKQFDLPERQSKLNTMLREEGLKDEQVYCICRSSDVTRFMIGCDNCEEWYHGDCINVTENEASRIRKFYCKKCRAKNPALQIKYKEKRIHHHHKHKHDKEKERTKDHKDKNQLSKSKRDSLSEKCGECEACYVMEDCGRCEYCKDMQKFGGSGNLKQKCKKRQCQNFYHLAKKHQSSSTNSSNEKHSVEYARSDHSYNSQPKTSNKPGQSLTAGTKPASATSSGSLIIKSLAEYSTSVPSSRVKNAESSPRDRTPPAPSSKSVQSLSDHKPKPVNLSDHKPKPLNLSDHKPKPLNLSDHKPKPLNLSDHKPKPLNLSDHKPKPVNLSDHKPKPVNLSDHKPKPVEVTNFTTPLTNLTNNTNNSANVTSGNVAIIANVVNNNYSNSTNSSNIKTDKNNSINQRLEPVEKSSFNDDVSSRNRSSIIDHVPWEPKKKKKETMSRKRKDLSAMRKRKAQDSGSDSDDPRGPLYGIGPRQCMGPQCIKAARPASKYCSDECGLKLAEARIYSVLPQRIQEWKMSSCIAEENDRKQLEKIRSQQLEARKALQMLDEKHKELDMLLEKWKAVPVDPQADEEIDEDTSEGAFIYCVTCGHEVPTRRAIKHMHSCFNKLESQMSFGSMFKTRIEGNNMFCDVFNPSNRTYCKRLRVMCPEHTKESKIPNTEVCGCPLTTNVFTETGKVCRASKKKCVKHYCWEKLRRANIDMERVRQCIKLDELVEQERLVRLAMTNRAGVLGLMLHSTYDHEYAAKLHHRQRQTDHQYHQKDKSKASSDNYKHFKDSTNYYNQYQKQSSDHHYHRQQQHQQQKQQDKSLVKKYQSNSSSVLSHSSTNQSHSTSKLQSYSGSNKPPQSYQRDHYSHSSDNQLNHDHQYFSNQRTVVDKRDDHLYSSKRQK